MDISQPLTEKGKGVSRRQFLLYAWVASGLIVLGEWAAAFLGFFRPQVAADAFGSKVRLGKPEEFPLRSVAYFRDAQLYLSHVEEGFLALYRKCTHLGCVVPWVPEEDRFHCPCHASLFNRHGEVLAGPAPRPLDLFPMTIEDEELTVDTGRIIERQTFEPSQAVSV